MRIANTLFFFLFFFCKLLIVDVAEEKKSKARFSQPVAFTWAGAEPMADIKKLQDIKLAKMAKTILKKKRSITDQSIESLRDQNEHSSETCTQ